MVKVEIEIDDHLYEECKKIAKRNEETFNDYIFMLLTEDLEAERYALKEVDSK